jgi:hypothetical protein
MGSRFLALTTGMIALLAACTQPIAYKGPGRLVDNGWMDPDHRYVVELGTLNLAKPGSTVFRFSGLPKAHYVAGLQIPLPADQGSAPDSGLIADVALQLMRIGEGQVLIVTGPLRSLNWAGAPRANSSFVYRQEKYESYFDAEPQEAYELRVIVNTADPSVPAGAKVVLKSGGWK